MARKPLYLKLTLREKVHEERGEIPFIQPRGHTEFRDLIGLISAARDHKRVKALCLVIKPISIGWAQIEELQLELDLFHKAGKTSFCFLESATNQSYYLASAAQHVFLPPAAQLELVGLRAEMFFFRGLLDQLGIEPELFNVGQFKSAAEMFTKTQMTEGNREMTDSILEDIQTRVIERIAGYRGVDQSTVQEWIHQGPYTAERALKAGIVDELLYEDEVADKLKQEVPSIRPIRHGKLRTRDGFLKRLITIRRPRIAYLVAEGVITQGTSKRSIGRRAAVGSETLCGFLKHARENKRIQAIVLRVNSPGGGALASDLIWREVLLTARKKPVIASFGNVAASGGYYLATAASAILSMPGTLTGSIGVIGGKFNAKNLLERLKIGVDFVDKGERAGYTSPTRPFTASEGEVVLHQIMDFYKTFLKRVEEGRHLTTEKVEDVAQGRVWTGSQAHEHGLVDQIGGISGAFETARRKAGIPKEKRVRVVQYSTRRGFKDLMSLPFLESMEKTRIWALMPFWLRFR